MSLNYVLDGTGMALTFFMATRMVLCFTSVVKLVLIPHQCSCCWTLFARHWAFLFFPSKWSEGGQEAEREHRKDSWPALGKGIFHIVSHHADIFQSSQCWETGWALVCLWGRVRDCLYISWLPFFFFPPSIIKMSLLDPCFCSIYSRLHPAPRGREHTAVWEGLSSVRGQPTRDK